MTDPNKSFKLFKSEKNFFLLKCVPTMYKKLQEQKEIPVEEVLKFIRERKLGGMT